MQQRLSIITLGVADLKKSRAFYDALGWQIANDDEEAENIVAYNLQSMTLALYPLDKFAEDAGIPLKKNDHSSFSIAYNVDTEDDVNATLDLAVQAGATLIKKAEKVFWGGYSGYFADPDGYLWEVAFNPFSKLGPNGEFQWGGVE